MAKWARAAAGVAILAVVCEMALADGIPLESKIKRLEVLSGVLCAEIGVFGIEALVYVLAAGLSLGRGFLTSAAANAASAAVAFLMPDELRRVIGPGVRYWVVLTGLIVTLAIELPIAMAINRRAGKALRLAGIAAVVNCATYTAATAWVMWLEATTPPFHGK